MDLLKVEYRYFPFAPPLCWVGGAVNFMYDQPKLNLLWLVYPEVDTLHGSRWEGNEIAESINTCLDPVSRVRLQGPPRGFLKYWGGLLDTVNPLMQQTWPVDYWQTMKRRVAEAEARLRAEQELPANTMLVDFKHRMRVA